MTAMAKSAAMAKLAAMAWMAALVSSFLLAADAAQSRDRPAPAAMPLMPVATAKPLHYAMNGNFDQRGRYIVGKAGFNLADISSVAQLNALDADAKALVWVGKCSGADEDFQNAVRPFIGSPKVFGFFLMDDPDPRGRLDAGRLSAPCTPERLKAESDWVHRHAPGAKTFIVLMNLGTAGAPSFEGGYTPMNSHVDLFGIDPYPCRTELQGCDYAMIPRYIAAAKSSGIPYRQMIPVYQSFGGGDWSDGDGGKYLMPTADQTRRMLLLWRKQVAAPEFDAVYSWGSQRSDVALESDLELQGVFSEHNHSAAQVEPPMRLSPKH